MTNHEIDAAVQTMTPTIMYPLFGVFQPLEQPGHRFLAAKDGLWLEVRRPWLHLICPLAKQTAVAMPYGQPQSHQQFAFGKLPLDLLRRFAAEAKEAAPAEHAAWLTWDWQLRQFQYRPVTVNSSSSARINYDLPTIGETEEFVVDLHSHGHDQAYFSRDDNDDDRGEVKIAGVFGHCHQDRPSVVFRLCVLGMFIDIPTDKLDI